MSSFLSSLGTKVAERWLGNVLPGLLLVAAAAVAHTLAHHHALDMSRLMETATAVAQRFDGKAISVFLLAVAVLLVSAAAVLLARGLGLAVQSVWLLSGPSWLIGDLVRRRQTRWDDAQSALRQAPQQRGASAPESKSSESADRAAQRASGAARRDAIAPCRPTRPTWIGDRLRCAGVRIQGQYGLDIHSAWPRLWLLFPDHVRDALRAARDGFDRAAMQTAWGLLYLAIGAWWWPSVLVGATVIAIGWRAGRQSAAVLADLVESAVDLHAVDLARAFGAEASIVTPRDGLTITERLRKEGG